MGTSGVQDRNTDEMPNRIGLANASPTNLRGGITIEPTKLPIHKFAKTPAPCISRFQHHANEHARALARRLHRFALLAIPSSHRPHRSGRHRILLRIVVWQGFQSGGLLPPCRGLLSPLFSTRSRKSARFQLKLSTCGESEKHPNVATARQLVIIASDRTTTSLHSRHLDNRLTLHEVLLSHDDTHLDHLLLILDRAPRNIHSRSKQHHGSPPAEFIPTEPPPA
jgi:hypothetical protein